ncbi:MAG: HD domain-containing protein [Candidatus Omnitrophica bacterium]|nr:HD domain-containing protein [Candidatus Omnitrophota bacterium]
MWFGLESLMQIDTKLPDWILLLGILISLMFALMMIYFARKSSSRAKSLDASFIYIVYALARAVEAKEEETGNHILRVGEFCALIAQNLGMPKQFVNDIRIQSVLHDIGKIHIPNHILRKPQALTPDEWELMKKHTAYGAVIIGNHQRLKIGKNIALTHHEKWDGSGYPCGLKGEAIPLEGQIIGIADIYDALRSPRPYKPGYDHKTAFKIITEGDDRIKPTHFSPRVLNAFKEVEASFEETYDKMKDIDAAKEFEKNLCL